jgi:predicted phosphohydrolase
MKTKVQYASDLHLEFPQNRKFIKENPFRVVGDVLVLAGDIVPFAVMQNHKDFFDYLSDHFEQTYWLPGNHEYYGYDISERSGVLEERITSNVTLLNNSVVEVNGTSMIFSTLWSRIGIENQWKIESSLNDFYQIRFHGSKFGTEQYNALHRDSVDFIRGCLQEVDGRRSVVFTHHCPTFLNYPAKYKGDVLNEAFATELYDMIEKSGVDYWVYGHHHYNAPEFIVGNTRMVTNQLGYVGYEKTDCFKNDRFFVL